MTEVYLDIFFARKADTNEIVHISEIPTSKRGAKCGCVCCDCGKPLDAKLGYGKRHRHFAHNKKFTDRKCTARAGETALHQYVKDCIEKCGSVWVPSVRYKHGVNSDDLLKDLYMEFMENEIPNISMENIDILDFKKEDKVYLSQEDFIRPDVLLCSDKGVFAVEVFVTHRLSAEKIKAYYSQRLSVLEIDFSDLKDSFSEMAKSEIDAIILGETQRKKWLFHEEARHAICDGQNLAKLLKLNYFPLARVVGIGEAVCNGRKGIVLFSVCRWADKKDAEGICAIGDRFWNNGNGGVFFYLEYLKESGNKIPVIGDFIKFKYSYDLKRIVGFELV